jgi:hypothetical protein
MKLFKVIAAIPLAIALLGSPMAFGLEVGNYWVVKNYLAYGGRFGVQVGYSLRDWRVDVNGVLSPGLTDGTKPPFIYSSFFLDVRSCDLQSPKTNVLSVYTAVSKTPICDFQVMAKVKAGFGATKLCADPTIIEPQSHMRGVICSHTQQVYRNTVYSEVSLECVDWNNCLSIKE